MNKDIIIRNSELVRTRISLNWEHLPGKDQIDELCVSNLSLAHACLHI